MSIERWLISMTDFAVHLQSNLHNVVSDATLSSIIEHQIDELQRDVPPIAKTQGREIDKCATELWNTCSRLKRDIAEKSGTLLERKTLSLAKVFAFLLLDLAMPKDKTSFQS
jgi:hypothetical protein